MHCMPNMQLQIEAVCVTEIMWSLNRKVAMRVLLCAGRLMSGKCHWPVGVISMPQSVQFHTCWSQHTSTSGCTTLRDTVTKPAQLAVQHRAPRQWHKAVGD